MKPPSPVRSERWTGGRRDRFFPRLSPESTQLASERFFEGGGVVSSHSSAPRALSVDREKNPPIRGSVQPSKDSARSRRIDATRCGDREPRSL
jgi:hypothetical protein